MTDLSTSSLGETRTKSEVIMDDNGNPMTINPSKVKPLGWRYPVFLILAIAVIVVHLFVVLLDVYLFTLIQIRDGQLIQEDFANPMGFIFILMADKIQFVSLISLLLSAIAYAFFFQRAMKNVRLLGATDATIRPFAVWAWHFVPFANLLMPMKAVSQIWFASLRLAERPAGGGGMIGLWWMGWIGAMIAQRILTVATSDPGITLLELKPWLIVEIGAAVFMSISAGCLIVISTKVKNMQKNLNQFGQVNVF